MLLFSGDLGAVVKELMMKKARTRVGYGLGYGVAKLMRWGGWATEFEI